MANSAQANHLYFQWILLDCRFWLKDGLTMKLIITLTLAGFLVYLLFAMIALARSEPPEG